jgi:hypothetical protein
MGQQPEDVSLYSSPLAVLAEAAMDTAASRQRVSTVTVTTVLGGKMSTIAKFTGWVQGRNHASLPVEITGITLPYEMIREVRVTGYFPALTPREIAFHFDELPKGEFMIGDPLVLTVERAVPSVAAEAMDPIDPVAAAEAARAAVGQPEPVVTTGSTTTVVTTGSPVTLTALRATPVDPL